ncbi:MAG: cytochrome C, partial [candidate division NC10 bacterium]|nr:cytochrome C [candidate division NC10 bacterium]
MADLKEKAAVAKPAAQPSGVAKPAVSDRVHVWPYL